MMRRLLGVIFCLALFALGCAVQGAPFERAAVPPGDSVIYVYRPYSFNFSLLRPVVTCGDESARIGPGAYHAFFVPTEHVSCSVDTSESGDKVDIDPDPRVHYLKEDFGWGKLTGHPRLNPIDNDKAQTEIQTCVREDALPAPQP
jgi:hypothetical protein